MTFQEEYNIDCVFREGNVFRKHRGKDILHKEYFIKFLDGTDLIVFVPHYFESIGIERLFIKEIKRNMLKQRSEKINKIICIKRK